MNAGAVIVAALVVSVALLTAGADDVLAQERLLTEGQIGRGLLDGDIAETGVWTFVATADHVGSVVSITAASNAFDTQGSAQK